MAFANEWFFNRELIKAPPAEAVRDCSASGSVDNAVAYWVEQLNFDGPAYHFRDYLRRFGAWDRAELCNHAENIQRMFWIMCCNLAEEYGRDCDEYPANFYLGD